MNTLSYAIVFVSDMDRSVAFYRDVLNFPLKHRSRKWTEFATEGATLALHLADASEHTHTHAATPAGHCQMGLTVSDLKAFHAELVARGVTCLQPPKEESFGRLAIYADPDGLPVSVSETEEASRTAGAVDGARKPLIIEPATKTQYQPLYKRLGGYDAIAAIVDAWFARIAADPHFARFVVSRNDFSRRRSRQLTVDFLGERTGGPCFYCGLDMKAAHQGLGITEELWDAGIRYLNEALDQLAIAPREKDDLMNLVIAYEEDVTDKQEKSID